MKPSIYSKGFTLIELIVVLAVFVFVIDATVTIFVSVVHHQKRILDQQELVNQENYVLETLSQSLRQAKVDVAGKCFSRPGNIYALTHPGVDGFYQGVRFVDVDGHCQEFFLDTDGIFKMSQDGGQPQPLISEKFRIKQVNFLLNGDKSLSVGGAQARVTMAFAIALQTDGETEDQTVQTTISHRNFILP